MGDNNDCSSFDNNANGVPKLLVELIESTKKRDIDANSLTFLGDNAVLTNMLMKVLRGELRADGTEMDVMFENLIRKSLTHSLSITAKRGDDDVDVWELNKVFESSHPDAASVIREALDLFSEDL